MNWLKGTYLNWPKGISLDWNRGGKFEWIFHLGNICKKGWGGYSKPSDDLEEMVKNGLLTKEAGPFGDVVYRPTNKGRGYINA